MEKFRVLIKSIILTLFYSFKNFFSRNRIAYSNNGVVVSLTTYDQRINSVFLTIESLINQKRMPSHIVLWLCNEDIINGLPSTLIRLKNRGLEIRIVESNIRSYKKLSYFCLHSNDFNFDFVVTVDDDVFYPSYWLDKLYLKASSNPKSICCYRGKSIKFNNDSVDNYLNWSSESDVCNSNPFLLMPTGVSGVCYPKGVITSEFYDFDGIEKFCKYADDVWYKLCSIKNNYDAKLVLTDNIHFTPVLTSLAKGLEVYNVQNGLNEKQFNDSMNYLEVIKNDFYK
ncbi:hypothetical protein K0J45_06970 [Shewanella alkalitolerans]|uniref:hypothetical protein n=1 Tax=Shewanella alkalitolerans TaxID=2864209 RepID=UPI001C65F49E|nr:hypothetical protein [Shewanella alkalitolerans]QYJ98960.1 hypothetical protein K0J45_06970 [Shewanella alkalitolerans]